MGSTLGVPWGPAVLGQMTPLPLICAYSTGADTSKLLSHPQTLTTTEASVAKSKNDHWGGNVVLQRRRDGEHDTLLACALDSRRIVFILRAHAESE
jgi:hypothetical protein